jgi:hypothetical protein
VSGAPSTTWELVRGGDPLAATRAAGRVLLPRASSTGRLVVSAALVHGALSLAWSAAIGGVMPRGLSGRDALAFGAGAGLSIAAIDLGAAAVLRGSHLAAIHALPAVPQVADHLLFGMCVAAVLADDDLRRVRSPRLSS